MVNIQRKFQNNWLELKNDIGNGGVKKINYVNVKKILLFEARHRN